MAKYLITEPAVVGTQYFDASAQSPSVIELPDDVDPSQLWEPVDAAAVAALKRLGVKRKVTTDIPSASADAPIDTLSGIQAQLPPGTEQQ